ncbi:hypothetical protein AVEN_251944-1 [Araneus ventricosus]|uniref:Uncharacterized protein n=1 Tax=Araneus ventricosus TaxID=182803 RepID=A0A4Y2TZ50_ARAVE|nr:hypothetical protein AVEN_251944-1 [Araneus ventricosus]
MEIWRQSHDFGVEGSWILDSIPSEIHIECGHGSRLPSWIKHLFIGVAWKLVKQRIVFRSESLVRARLRPVRMLRALRADLPARTPRVSEKGLFFGGWLPRGVLSDAAETAARGLRSSRDGDAAARIVFPSRGPLMIRGPVPPWQMIDSCPTYKRIASSR